MPILSLEEERKEKKASNKTEYIWLRMKSIQLSKIIQDWTKSMDEQKRESEFSSPAKIINVREKILTKNQKSPDPPSRELERR